ncbi:MAG: acid phosphatase, partial [Hoylesella buccalis]
CGHIHNFQYIKKKGDNINYWVNSAAALSRPVQPTDGTRWCDGSTGFTVISANKQQLTLYAINKEGKILYTLPVKK